MAQMVKTLPAMWRHRFDPWVGKIPWRRAWQPTPVFLPGESPWIEEPGLENSTERGARMLAPWKKSYDQPREHLRKQRHYFANKGPYSQSYGFFSSHVWMWELDHKEGWTLKNWCFWTVVLEKTLESPLDCKIKPVNPKEFNPEYSLEGLMLKLKLQ